MTYEEIKAIQIIEDIKESIDWDCKENIEKRNAIETVLNLIQKQKEELKKKDKVIDLIVEMLRYYNGMHQEQCFCIDICENIECDEDNCYNRIKEYFYKKVEGK